MRISVKDIYNTYLLASSVADVGSTGIISDLNNFRQYVPHEHEEEIASVIEKNKDNTNAIIDYLLQPTENKNTNIYKRILYFLFHIKEENSNLIVKDWNKRGRILLCNTIICVICGILTYILFNPKFFSWPYNRITLFEQFPPIFYQRIVGVVFFINVILIFLVIFSLNTKGISDGYEEGKRLLKKYSLYVSNKENLKEYLDIRQKCSVVFAISLDLMIINIILLYFFMESVFSYNYGFNIFLVVVTFLLFFLISSITLTVMNKKSNEKLDMIFDTVNDETNV